MGILIPHKFMLSGVPGLYEYDQNPSEMDVVPPLQQFNIFNTIEGENVYQQSFIDNETRKMSWQKTTKDIYLTLKQYAERDAYGNIPTSYFWDGTVMEMQGVPIKVIDVIGKPIKGVDHWQVELLFKPEEHFDVFYELSPF